MTAKVDNYGERLIGCHEVQSMGKAPFAMFYALPDIDRSDRARLGHGGPAHQTEDQEQFSYVLHASPSFAVRPVNDIRGLAARESMSALPVIFAAREIPGGSAPAYE